MKRRPRKGTSRSTDIEKLLASAGVPHSVVTSQSGQLVFSKGDSATSVMYVVRGTVKLSAAGQREAVVGLLGPGDFFGEECLAGRAMRRRTATAVTECTTLVIGKSAMARLLRHEPAVADRFMRELIFRKGRLEDDLIDQLHSRGEQRLARTLLILAGYGRGTRRKYVVPEISQTTLAGIVGTTRSRVNQFLRHFKERRLIDMNGTTTVRSGLVTVLSASVRAELRGK